ncbi:MAG: hypothetical protein FWD64_12065 [Acidobacteriaceae bacterium]|nr:hypothetical protein [Acidobacteriaceae bacterium]
MSSSHKKVVVRRFVGDTLAGYLPLSGFVSTQATGERSLGLLDLSGRVTLLPLGDIKYVCYVRDFNLNDNLNPERLERRAFLSRPRTEGLWLRVTFRATAGEPEQMEGLAPINTSLLDDMLEDAGLFLTPPDARANTQRIYVPRQAIAELQLIDVVTTPSRIRPTVAAPKAKAKPALKESFQEDLFHFPLPPNARPN